MQVIRSYAKLDQAQRGCVATIGNFDGVHLGHRAVAAQLLALGKQVGLPVVLITFEPQPQEYFFPDKAPARLTRLREKLTHLDTLGVDRVLVLRFDAAFAALTADQFVQQILVDGLGVQHVVVGDDFRFGKSRGGDIELLKMLGDTNGFDVSSLVTFAVDDARVSSTRIRSALADGQFKLVEKLLGRPFSIGGHVAYGHQRGRSIGFPTANIPLKRTRCPLQGVYAVKVRGLDDECYFGVANIGNRPTVDAGTQPVLEVHIFNFDDQIYGRLIEVEFCRRLRDEKKFESFDVLKQQIQKDAEEARNYFELG